MDQPDAGQLNKQPAYPVKTPGTHLKLKYKRFADRYLVNGMNATEAYQHVFNPKGAESSHSAAYRVLAAVGVKEYILQRLEAINQVEYEPEAIKSALAVKARSAKRDSDAIRALELMSKITGLLDESAQVNVLSSDTLSVIRQRLKERKNSPQKLDNNQVLNPEVIDAKEVTESMSDNVPYGPDDVNRIANLDKNDDVIINDGDSGHSVPVDGGGPGVGRGEEPHPPVKVDTNHLPNE